MNRSVVFFYPVNGTSGAIGDVLCYNSDASALVVATTANLATAGGVYCGIQLNDTGTDGTAQVQSGGMVPNSITGLGAGSAGFVKINSSGRLARASSVADTPIFGKCDALGNVFVYPSEVTEVSNVSITSTQVSADYTILGSDQRIVANAASSAITLTLPSPTSVDTEQAFEIFTLGSKGVTLDAGSGKTINGLRRYFIRGPYKSAIIRRSSTTAWQLSAVRLDYIDVRDFGAVGDGVTDDTTALQAALDYFSGASNANTACLYIPFGTFCHTGLVLIGSAGNGFTIRGESVGRLPYGSVLKYIGSAGGTAFEFRGVNNTTVDHIGFDGGGLAAKGVLLKTNQVAGGAGLSGLTFNKCIFNGPRSTSAFTLVEVGHDAGGPTYQVSECEWINCTFYGDDTDPAKAANGTGWKTIVGGNTKNFRFCGGGFTGLNVGLDWSNASGTLIVENSGGGNIISSLFKLGGSVCRITNCGFENANVTSEYYAAKFIDSDGAPSGTLLVQGCYVNSDLSESADNVGINYPGHMTLIGNTFRDESDGGEFKVQVGNTRVGTVSNDGSLTSIGNVWVNGLGRIRVIDGSGNELTQPGSIYADPTGFPKLAVRSFGDSAGVEPWESFDGMMPVFGDLRALNATSWSAGSTLQYEGKPRYAPLKWTISYTALKNNAMNFADFIIGYVPDKAKILSIAFHVTTGFVLPGSTYVIIKGNLQGDVFDYQDATAPIVVGSDSAHLSAFHAARLSQGAYWHFPGSASPLYLIMASDVNIGNGTVTNFTAGEIDVYVTYEPLAE